MKRASGAALLAALALLAGCSQTTTVAVSGITATGSAADFSKEPLGEFSRKRAMNHVRKLSKDIGVRVRATKGERRAADYIRAKLDKLGYETHVQKFDVDGGTSRNVTARWPGARRYGIVIGGHMDTVPGSPGANDNASGAAVVLEMARLAAGKKPAKNLQFVAFGSEEFGTNGAHHVGSQVFVNRLDSKGRRKLGGMVSVDMIADGRPLITGTAGIGPDVLARMLFRKFKRAGFGVDYQTTCDCSDNGPFERAGIPAAFLWSGDEPDYHDESDRPKNLSKKDLRRTGRAVLEFVDDVDDQMLERLRQY